MEEAMGITELKQKHNERIINLVVTDIVIAGLTQLKNDGEVKSPDNPLVESWKKCFDDINDSSWDDIRAIIKRSL